MRVLDVYKRQAQFTVGFYGGDCRAGTWRLHFAEADYGPAPIPGGLLRSAARQHALLGDRASLESTEIYAEILSYLFRVSQAAPPEGRPVTIATPFFAAVLHRDRLRSTDRN